MPPPAKALGPRRGGSASVAPVTHAIRSLVIPVSDIDAAKAIYSSVLGAPHTDTPYYVGYNIGGFEVALAPGDAGGPVANIDVDDLDAARDALIAAGAAERDAPREVAPGVRVAVLTDGDGNPIGLRGA